MWNDHRRPLSSIPVSHQNHTAATSTSVSSHPITTALNSSRPYHHDSLPKLQLLRRIDFSSIERVAAVLDAAVVMAAFAETTEGGSDHASSSRPNLPHDLIELADEVVALLEFTDTDGVGTLQVASQLPPSHQLALASLQDSIASIEFHVHPVLKQCNANNVSPLGGTTASMLPTTATQPILIPCPICTAASMGATKLLRKLLPLSSATAEHSMLAARGSLWSGASASTEMLYHGLVTQSPRGEMDVLCRFVVEQTRFLVEWVTSLHIDRTPPVVPSQHSQRYSTDGTSFVSVDEGEVMEDWEGPNPSSSSLLSSYVTSEEELIVLGALEILFNVCGGDADCLQTTVYLLLNVPFVAVRGGTLVHLLVAVGFPRCLRMILEQLELSTRTQRRSLRSVSRVHALRCESLNRRDLNGFTPLSIAIAAHDSVAARLLIIHGASTYTGAKSNSNDVVLRSPRELLVLHCCTHEMQRLFYPLTTNAGGHQERVLASSTPPQHIGLPTFEYLDESLQRSLGSCISRSSVGELLLGVSRRLADHLLQQQQASGLAKDAQRAQRYAALLDTTMRSYFAAFHADPWNHSAAQELDELLRRHMSPSATASGISFSESERRVAQQICGIIGRGILSNRQGPSSHVAVVDVVVLPSPDLMHGGGNHHEHSFRSSSVAGPSVLCEDMRGDSAQSDPHHTGGAGGPRVTHVRVLCPVATITRGGGGPPSSTQPTHSCLVLWVRLSPLMGHISLDHADEELMEGHGFVEGVTAPGCPIQSDDLVFFSRGGSQDSSLMKDERSFVTFVATRCVQEGAVRVPMSARTSHNMRPASHASGPTATLRRVRCGLWSQPEDPIHFPDPTLWMDNKQLFAQSGGGSAGPSSSFLNHVCTNAVQWRQLQENVLRVETRNTFWALQEGLATAATTVSDSFVTCVPLIRHTMHAHTPPSTRLAQNSNAVVEPWNSPGWVAVVDGKTDLLVGLSG
ncbi:Hypothetical protein, putative [Bodo saltans]|uniref:Ankyrin repeat protein n=1 Tax=Bodo saltans TaxID=75058 RepID=A0A0S4IVU7_BODSA|nr:Hypothetical protein, putative [Bodo saltans]|eukprot:CUF65666.1 Hypothetical protein, putative [Bodo saltans]